MAFSFSNAGAGASPFGAQGQANGTPQASEGLELAEITTNEIGYLPLAGEAKLQLLPSSWPSDSLPPPTASLLSVASSKGLLAAGGPDTLILAPTEAVRAAFRASGSAEIKPFDAQIKISVPKLSQVVFSADENVLVISAADGGGLAAYQVEGLINGKTEPTLQIATDQTPLRALAPNPMSESAELFAAVTTKGDLLLANLKSGKLEAGPSGTTLKSGVSCIAWSTKGKQLVAGLADGSAVQMKPNGEVTAQIPKPPSLGANHHISHVSWLENDVFLMIYTPNDTDGDVPPSDFYVLTRKPKTKEFTFQKLPEVCGPFGLPRTPSVQMTARLRNFPPNIQHMLVVASTTSTDLGLVTKSDKALSPENVIDSFTMTTMADDSRRAEMPLGKDGAETSPIGVQLDLSAKEKVDNPIPGDSEILQSDSPLPNLMVLNNEGVLASWWIVYSASVREKKPYPGLAVLGGNTVAESTPAKAPVSASNAPAFGQLSMSSASATPTPAFGQPTFGSTATPAPASTPAAPAFGQSSFGSSPTPSKSFGSTTTPAFGQSSFGSAPAFGKPSGPSFGAPSLGGSGGSSTGGFGQPSGLGGSKPSWASGTGAFGTSAAPSSSQPAFGASSSLGKPGAAPAFGSPSNIGKPSPSTGATPQFGATGFGTGSGFGSAQPKSVPFGASPNGGNAGFSSFANTGGFGSAKPSGGSPFAAKPSTESPFGAKSSNDSPFGKPAGESTFGKPSTDSAFGKPQSAIPFGQPAGVPTFGKPSTDSPFAKPQNAIPFGKPAGESVFGKPPPESAFGKPTNTMIFGQPTTGSTFGKPSTPSIFGQKTPTQSFESNMEATTTSAPSSTGIFGNGSNGFKLGSTFKGDGSSKDDLPKSKADEAGGSLFGSGFGNLLGSVAKEPTPAQNKEEEMDDDEDTKPTKAAEPPAPLPPLPPLPPQTLPKATTEQPPPLKEAKLTTPPGTVIHSKATPAPPLSNLFGTNTQPNTTPAEVQKSKPWSFAAITSTTPTAPPKSVPFPAQPKEIETPKIKTEPPSEEGSPIAGIPEAPLPPDSTSKATYAIGDTSVSSIGSKESLTPDAPLPPDFLIPKAKAKEPEADEAALPDDGSDLSSDFGSQDELSQAASPTEVPSTTAEQVAEELDDTSDFKASPESSFSKEDEKSPAGGLFTKITALPPQPKSNNRPLFGEIKGGPIFAAPKPPQSPRSPSPVRQFRPDILRPEGSRSASAPIRPGSAISAKRAELSKSQVTMPQPAFQEQQRIQQEKLAASRLQSPAEEERPQLVDDEAERLHAELQRPVSPSETLDPFLYHQEPSNQPTKPGMPGQIERLYQDINSMIDTLGLNSRALSAFILYQRNPHEKNESWPEVLLSAEPSDAHDEEWLLVDIERLDEGYDTVIDMIEDVKVTDFIGKMQKCQALLTKDLVQLRTKISALRKTLHSQSDLNKAPSNSLSSEQASIQHDLRKASTLLQAKLAEAEQGLAVLRAKLTEVPQTASNRLQRKPTVESVTHTIKKMTMMAEKKSADVEQLEAQLTKLSMGPKAMNGSANGSRHASVEPEFQPRTPQKSGSRLRDSTFVRTPASSGSTYHTPDSKLGASIRSTPGRFRSSLRDSVGGDGVLVSREEAERWRQKARRKKEVEATLKEALKARRMNKQAITA